ncbi:hypothetical protein [Streptomyces sp. NPDC088258]|uniref:hypothetical protein n=1 Tax=Streptomyces sp. NPDC088258 TaxID=3365849 RepID=UPI0038119139
MPDLMVQIDGQTIPLKDCFWVLADTTGCVYSSAHGNTAVNEEAAHRHFTPRQHERARHNRQGWTVQLLTPQQWSEQAKPCFMGRCPHSGLGKPVTNVQLPEPAA